MTDAIAEVVAASEDLSPVLVVGAPIAHGNRVLNAAVVIHRGRILGVAPKSYLPTYREFYERRWFAPGDDVRGTTVLAGQEVPIGPDLLFEAVDVRGLVLHVEVCEDMWVPVPPSAEAALAGATVLANLSGSPITVGRAEDRRPAGAQRVVRAASRRTSTPPRARASRRTDLSWDGQTMVYEMGDLLGETERFPDGPRATIVDVDLDRIRLERLRAGTFDDNRARPSGSPSQVPHGRVRARADHAPTSGCAARSTGSRSCPTTPSGSPRTATRPTTSRSPGSSSG